MNRFNRKLIIELTVFVGFLLLAVASRFWLADMPNFKPVAACALLSGFLFSRIWLALALPLLVMLVSDWQIGSYEATIMVAVYGSLAACPLLGFAAKRISRSRKFDRAGEAGLVAGSALAMSILFFVSTNLAVWTQWYPMNVEGLGACFLAALPFFKFTILGNLLFSMGGLAAYWVASGIANRWSEKSNPDLIAS
jgi:hypothetical protein